ncbi:hypothetical protein MBANPS3_012227 [Mucor bainieri]
MYSIVRSKGRALYIVNGPSCLMRLTIWVRLCWLIVNAFLLRYFFKKQCQFSTCFDSSSKSVVFISICSAIRTTELKDLRASQASRIDCRLALVRVLSGDLLVTFDRAEFENTIATWTEPAPGIQGQDQAAQMGNLQDQLAAMRAILAALVQQQGGEGADDQ